MKGEKEDQVRIRSKKHFIGVHIHPGTRRGISKGHGYFLDGRDGGLKRSSIVTGKGADIVRPIDGEKKMRLVSINKFVKDSRWSKIELMEAPVGEAVTDRGVGFGKMESKAI